jgi:hypothetical protein
MPEHFLNQIKGLARGPPHRLSGLPDSDLPPGKNSFEIKGLACRLGPTLADCLKP